MSTRSLLWVALSFGFSACSRANTDAPSSTTTAPSVTKRAASAARDKAVVEALAESDRQRSDPRARGGLAADVLSKQFDELASARRSFLAMSAQSIEGSQVGVIISNLFDKDATYREAFDKACSPGWKELHPSWEALHAKPADEGPRLAAFRKACGDRVKIDASEARDVRSMAYALTVVVSARLEAGGALSEKERALVHHLLFVAAENGNP